MKAVFATVAIPPPLRGDGFQIGGALPATFYRKGEAAWAKQTLAALQKETQTVKTELAQLTSELGKRIAPPAGFALQSMGGSLGNN